MQVQYKHLNKQVQTLRKSKKRKSVSSPTTLLQEEDTALEEKNKHFKEIFENRNNAII